MNRFNGNFFLLHLLKARSLQQLLGKRDRPDCWLCCCCCTVTVVAVVAASTEATSLMFRSNSDRCDRSVRFMQPLAWPNGAMLSGKSIVDKRATELMRFPASERDSTSKSTSTITARVIAIAALTTTSVLNEDDVDDNRQL